MVISNTAHSHIKISFYHSLVHAYYMLNAYHYPYRERYIARSSTSSAKNVYYHDINFFGS